MKSTLIAQVCHAINLAYCTSIGDNSQPEWAEAPEWQQQSALAGVDMHLANPDATPKDSHESWLAVKLADGWKYGKVKDAEKKEHPCCVPYDELPTEQKTKDYLFRAVVHALKDIPDADEAVAEFIQNMPTAEAPVTAIKPMANCTAVEYIGTRDLWTDRVYHTGLTFTPGMVRNLPNGIASKLLRHADVFTKAAIAPAGDDTAHQLTEGDKAQKQRAETQIDFDVIAQVNSMEDRDALVELAMSRYQIKLTKAMKPETMRAKIIEHINRFGSR